VNTDKHGINELRQRLDFPEVAARFKLIDDTTVPLVVRYHRGFPGGRSPAAPADPWRAFQGLGPFASQAATALPDQRSALPWPDTNSQVSFGSCPWDYGSGWKIIIR